MFIPVYTHYTCTMFIPVYTRYTCTTLSKQTKRPYNNLLNRYMVERVAVRLNSRSKNGNTALHLAVIWGRVEICGYVQIGLY